VKQGDLGEYEENAREKQIIQYTRQKHQLPPQTKPYGWQTPHFKLKRVVTKTRSFSMQKAILPLKPRRNTPSVNLKTSIGH
jgi:hypothetical protein